VTELVHDAAGIDAEGDEAIERFDELVSGALTL